MMAYNAAATAVPFGELPPVGGMGYPCPRETAKGVGLRSLLWQAASRKAKPGLGAQLPSARVRLPLAGVKRAVASTKPEKGGLGETLAAAGHRWLPVSARSSASLLASPAERAGNDLTPETTNHGN